MAMQVTIGYGDEGGYQRTEQEVLAPLRRTTTSCVAMSSIAVVLAPPHRRHAGGYDLAAGSVRRRPGHDRAGRGELTLVSRVLTRANGEVSWPVALRCAVGGGAGDAEEVCQLGGAVFPPADTGPPVSFLTGVESGCLPRSFPLPWQRHALPRGRGG
jgi:hypothetical protein